MSPLPPTTMNMVLPAVADHVDGLGDPLDGTPALIRVGAPPFEWLPLVGDGEAGQWVSAPLQVAAQALTLSTQNTVGDLLQDTGRPHVPWRVLDNAGLKPQVRMIAQLSHTGPTTATAAEAWIQLQHVDLNNNPSVFGNTLVISNNAPGNTQAKDSGWVGVPNDPRDFLILTPVFRVTNATFFAFILSATILLRWLSK